MDSPLTRLVRSPRSHSDAVFWTRIAAQTLFGVLLIFDSLYLVVCYITVNFFGFLSNNPIFAGIQGFASVAGFLYFPAFVGALLTVDVGQQRQRSQRLAAVFLIA